MAQISRQEQVNKLVLYSVMLADGLVDALASSAFITIQTPVTLPQSFAPVAAQLAVLPGARLSGDDLMSSHRPTTSLH